MENRIKITSNIYNILISFFISSYHPLLGKKEIVFFFNRENQIYRLKTTRKKFYFLRRL